MLSLHAIAIFHYWCTCATTYTNVQPTIINARTHSNNHQQSLTIYLRSSMEWSSLKWNQVLAIALNLLVKILLKFCILQEKTNILVILQHTFHVMQLVFSRTQMKCRKEKKPREEKYYQHKYRCINWYTCKKPI